VLPATWTETLEVAALAAHLDHLYQATQRDHQLVVSTVVVAVVLN
jgi:hypothetical protein